MAQFHITIEGMWSNDGKWEVFNARPDPIVPTKVTVKRTEFLSLDIILYDLVAADEKKVVFLQQIVTRNVMLKVRNSVGFRSSFHNYQYYLD